MEGKKGRLTQDVLRAVCIIVIIFREVIDPVTASFVDSCESDTAAIRRSSRDSAVMLKGPDRHPRQPPHTSILWSVFDRFTNLIKSISIPGSNITKGGGVFEVTGRGAGSRLV